LPQCVTQNHPGRSTILSHNPHACTQVSIKVPIPEGPSPSMRASLSQLTSRVEEM